MNGGRNGTSSSSLPDRLWTGIPVRRSGAPQYTKEFTRNVKAGGRRISSQVFRLTVFSLLLISSLLITSILHTVLKMTSFFPVSSWFSPVFLTPPTVPGLPPSLLQTQKNPQKSLLYRPFRGLVRDSNCCVYYNRIQGKINEEKRKTVFPKLSKVNSTVRMPYHTCPEWHKRKFCHLKKLLSKWNSNYRNTSYETNYQISECHFPAKEQNPD